VVTADGTQHPADARSRADAIEVSEGGCDSWYLDADGVNRTLWPGFSFEYWARTRRARRADYAVAGRP
jgi:hypothetical protein